MYMDTQQHVDFVYSNSHSRWPCLVFLTLLFTCSLGFPINFLVLNVSVKNIIRLKDILVLLI